MNKYRLYQVNEEHFRDVAFSSYYSVKRRCGEPRKEWYMCVYEFESDRELGPDDLYRMFNLNHPEDFKGRSLSVSDVVEMPDGYWYCDSFGWQELDWGDQ